MRGSRRSNKLSYQPGNKGIHFLRLTKLHQRVHCPCLFINSCLLGKQKNKAARLLQNFFNKNNWTNTWTNGIYNFRRYHSNTHECMGIAGGKAWIVFGGIHDKTLLIEKGNIIIIIIIPAGLAHKCSKTTSEFLCVGGYPGGAEYRHQFRNERGTGKSSIKVEKTSQTSTRPGIWKRRFFKSFLEMKQVFII